MFDNVSRSISCRVLKGVAHSSTQTCRGIYAVDRCFFLQMWKMNPEIIFHKKVQKIVLNFHLCHIFRNVLLEKENE